MQLIAISCNEAENALGPNGVQMFKPEVAGLNIEHFLHHSNTALTLHSRN